MANIIIKSDERRVDNLPGRYEGDRAVAVLPYGKSLVRRYGVVFPKKYAIHFLLRATR